MTVKRGEVYYCDLGPATGNVQGGVRPVVVISNNIGNKEPKNNICIVAVLTSRLKKGFLPTHVDAKAEECGLAKDSIIMLEQIRTIDKRQLREFITMFSQEKLEQIDDSLALSVGLFEL